MSAINAFQYPKAAYLFTDGASYTPDGRLLAITSKVSALPHLDAAIAARGPSLFRPIVATLLGQEFHDFDGLIAGAADVVHEAVDDFAHIFDHCSLGVGFDLVLVGWSRLRNRGETYVLTSINRPGSQKPWELVEHGSMLMMPMDPDCRGRLSRLGAGGNFDTSDPARLGLAVMEEQRGIKAVQAEGYEASAGVGGHCEMTTIGPDGITSRIIHRWADRIGEPLGGNPTPVQAEPPAVAGATVWAWTPPPDKAPSRHERRAAEKQAKRERARA